MSEISQRERELLNEVAALRRRIAREETKEFSGGSGTVSPGTTYPQYSGVPTAGAIAYWTGNGTVAAASFGTSVVTRYSGVPTAGAMAYWTANGTIAAAGFGTSTVTQYSGTQSAGVFAYFTGTGTITANAAYGTATMPIYNGAPAANDMTYWNSANRLTNAPFGTADVALLAGRSGGQTLKGGTASGDDLTLDSTNHATKGDVYINPSGGQVGVKTTTIPANHSMAVAGAGATPEASAVLTTQTAVIGIHGDGHAYFMGRDVTNDIEFLVGTSTTGVVFIGAMTDHPLVFRAGNGAGAGNVEYGRIASGGNWAIGATSSSAKLQVEQSSTTAAIPTLRLKQSDLSEEFIRFESTVSAGNPINTTALGAYYGRVRVYVEGVGAKWLALYD